MHICAQTLTKLLDILPIKANFILMLYASTGIEITRTRELFYNY